MKRSAETRIQKAYTYDGKDDYDECDYRVYDLCVSSILFLLEGRVRIAFVLDNQAIKPLNVQWIKHTIASHTRG